MAILLEAASHRDRRTVARHSRSPPPTEPTALQLPRVSRPIHLRMQPGRCKVRFAMCPGPVDTLTRQAPTPRQGLILVLLPQQHITVTVAPATVASQLQGHLMANPQMWPTGRVRVQVPWVLLGRLVLLILLHSCKILRYIIIRPRHASIRLIQSLWGVFVFLFLGTFLAFCSFSFLSSDRAG